MRNIITLDFETAGDVELAEKIGYFEDIKAPEGWKDPEKIQRRIKEKKQKMLDKLALEPRFANVRLATLYLNGTLTVISGDEPKILDKSWRMVRDVLLSAGELATFNGKHYDIPVLYHRALKHKLPLEYREIELLTKYSNKFNHHDLSSIVSGNLDNICAIAQGEGKKEIDFLSASIEELKEYATDEALKFAKLVALVNQEELPSDIEVVDLVV
jgi:hypothetical protein